MKKLVLMRHAEAQPTHLAPIDRDRPLALMGLQQLERIRNPLQKAAEGVSLVLCSNARRSRQTLEAIRSILPSRCDTEFTDILYQATPERIMNHLAGVADAHTGVLIVAHNPGLSNFLNNVIECHSSQKNASLGTADVVTFQGNFNTWIEIGYPKLHLEKILRA